jgi:hypothetical protein
LTAEQWFRQTGVTIGLNKSNVYPVYYKLNTVDFANVKIIDSLLATAAQYTDSAAVYNQSQIKIVIRTNNLFKKPITRTFDRDSLINQRQRLPEQLARSK